jgi:hypothetical protein
MGSSSTIVRTARTQPLTTPSDATNGVVSEDGEEPDGNRSKLLQEQLKAKLIALRRCHAPTGEVIQADEKTPRVGTQRRAKNRSGETADHGSQDKRGDW